jgi:hypothetical protein
VRRKRNGVDGVYIFLPFVTEIIDNHESAQVNMVGSYVKGVMVNVGFMPLKKFQRNGLKDFKLPDMPKVITVNNKESIL